MLFKAIDNAIDERNFKLMSDALSFSLFKLDLLGVTSQDKEWDTKCKYVNFDREIEILQTNISDAEEGINPISIKFNTKTDKFFQIDLDLIDDFTGKKCGEYDAYMGIINYDKEGNSEFHLYEKTFYEDKDGRWACKLKEIEINSDFIPVFEKIDSLLNPSIVNFGFEKECLLTEEEIDKRFIFGTKENLLETLNSLENNKVEIETNDIEL